MIVIRNALLSAAIFTGLLLNSAQAITPAAFEHYNKGAQFEKLQDFRAAEQEYRLALALDPYDSLTYIKLASILERDGKRDEAISLYQKALDINPSDVNVRLSLAQLLEAKNQPEKALDQYQQLVQGNRDYVYGYLPMARLHKEMNRDDKAIEAYQEFLRLYPNHYDAQRELASLLLANKQYDKAADAYKSLKSAHEGQFKDDLAYAISLNNADKAEEALEAFKQVKTPSAVMYEQMGMSYEKLNRLPEAHDAYQKAIDMAPNSKYNLYLKQADIAASLNQPHTSITALENYLKRDPQNGAVYKSLAELYTKQKDYPAAVERYEDALKYLPSSDKKLRSETLRDLGYVYQVNGQLDQAAKTYESALTLEDNAQTRLNLALTYHQKEEYEKALELYRKLMVENPNSQTLKKDAGQVLLALGHKAYKAHDYPAAIRYFQDAYLLGNEQETQALLGIGNAQYAMKDTTMAYTTYKRILEKDPGNMAARLNKAQLDLDQKNYMEALENLRWIVNQKPDLFDAYKMLAQTHEGLGDYGQAILNYQKALEIQPKDYALLVGYGNVWRQVGDLDRAQKAYEMAKAESPNNPVLRYNLGSLYNLKENLDASLQEYKAAVDLNPGFAEPYYGMGTTYEKQKKYDKALEVYQMYLEKAPASASYVPLAKQRVELLKKTQQPPGVKPSATKTALPGKS